MRFLIALVVAALASTAHAQGSHGGYSYSTAHVHKHVHHSHGSSGGYSYGSAGGTVTPTQVLPVHRQPVWRQRLRSVLRPQPVTLITPVEVVEEQPAAVPNRNSSLDEAVAELREQNRLNRELTQKADDLTTRLDRLEGKPPVTATKP